MKYAVVVEQQVTVELVVEASSEKAAREAARLISNRAIHVRDKISVPAGLVPKGVKVDRRKAYPTLPVDCTEWCAGDPEVQSVDEDEG